MRRFDSGKIAASSMIVLLVGLLAGCGGGDNKEAHAPATVDSQASEGANSPSAESDSGKKDAKDALQDAVVGAKMSYFDDKFGAGTKGDADLTYSYENGKLRVLENEGIAYTIYTDFKGIGETPNPDEALEYISDFLPADAKLTKDEKDETTKTHTYTYTSKALDEATRLGGQLILMIMQDFDDPNVVRQAQIAIDITANF